MEKTFAVYGATMPDDDFDVIMISEDLLAEGEFKAEDYFHPGAKEIKEEGVVQVSGDEKAVMMLGDYFSVK